MPAFATHAACLASLVAAPLENLDQNQYLHQLGSVTGNKQLAKVEFSLGIIQIAFSHKQAELAWGQYKMNSKRGITIAEQMGSARSLTISQNCHYIKTIAEILLFCSRQEVALRGHRESNEQR